MDTNAPRASRVVILGDIHDQYHPEYDIAAIKFLNADLALFVGDYGDGNVALVKEIADARVPKALIMGNHDAWVPGTISRVSPKLWMESLRTVRDFDVGFCSKTYPGAGLAVVGGRPFSDGGTLERLIGELYLHFHNVADVHQSATLIRRNILKAAQGDYPIIVLAHAGPCGQGSTNEAISGKDFDPNQGDFGDVDLADGLEAAQEAGARVPLCVFGHMHENLMFAEGERVTPAAPKLRHRVFLGTKPSNTVFVNTAVVPRWRSADGLRKYITLHRYQPTPRNLSLRPNSAGYFCHYTVVDLVAGQVMRVEDVWVEPGKDVAGCRVVWRKLLLERRKDHWLVYDNYEHKFEEVPQ